MPRIGVSFFTFKNTPDNIYILRPTQDVHDGHYQLLKRPYLGPVIIEDVVISKLINRNYKIDYIKLNIDYELCDKNFNTFHIPECSLNHKSSFLVTKDNREAFFEITDKCINKGGCDRLYNNKDSLKQSIIVKNQYWLKEISEYSLSIDLNNEFYTFYSLKKYKLY